MMQKFQPQSKVESIQVSIKATPSAPFEEEECIKEVVLEETNKAMFEGDHDQGSEEVQLESKVDLWIKVAKTY